MARFAQADRAVADSQFQPYYRMLPTSFSEMPVLWPEGKLARLLGGTAIVAEVRLRQRELREDYDFLCATVGPSFGAAVSREAWGWARCVVWSRAFAIQLRPRVERNVLVPLVDMMDHQHNPRKVLRAAAAAPALRTLPGVARTRVTSPPRVRADVLQLQQCRGIPRHQGKL